MPVDLISVELQGCGDLPGRRNGSVVMGRANCYVSMLRLAKASAWLAAVMVLLVVLVGFFLPSFAQNAWAAEGSGDAIYAVYYKNGHMVLDSDGAEMEAFTLVIQTDPNPDNAYGTYDPSLVYLVGSGSTEGPKRGWDSNVDDQVSEVIVRDRVAPIDTVAWFKDLAHCSSVDLSKLDMSRVAATDYMFEGCTALKEIDAASWNTSSVASTDFMFGRCESLKTVDVSQWNMSNAETAAGMFWACSALQSVDVSRWDTAKLRSTMSMFLGCVSLEAINVENWNTVNLAQTALMFEGCESLRTVSLAGWSTPSLNMCYEMFDWCISLESVDISGLDMSGVSDAMKSAMFLGCRSLSWIKVGSKSNASGILPAPSSQYIKGATGRWVNANGQVFAPEAIPANKAAIYAAEGSAAAKALVKPVAPPQPKLVSLAGAKVTVASGVWTGKALKPSVVVKLGGKTLRVDKDYTVAFKRNKNVGTATVAITGKGAYTGSKFATFKIVPKGVVAEGKVKFGKKSFTVKWSKPSKSALKQTTGYQVRYSLKKSMKRATVKTVKATSSAGKKCTLKVSKLKGGKKYYIQVRTYKKVAGKTYYSGWSKTKTVKVKS